MWSVWPEFVEIYLGQAMALLKQHRQEAKAIHFRPGMPLEQVLLNLSKEMSSRSGLERTVKRKRRKLRVTLSAGVCPAFGLNPPSGIQRWDELSRFARATAATKLSVNPESLICEMDDQGLGIAAAVPQHLISEFHRWASVECLSLVSVQPLWTTATQCQLARKAVFKAVVVQEPDSITLIAVNSIQAVATTLPMEIGVEVEPTVTQAHIRRWLVSNGLNLEQSVTLRFGKANQSALPLGPKTWAKHWTAP